MSVQTEIDRINENVANTYSVLEGAGADMPQTRNTANLSEAAASIKAVLYSKAQSLTEAQKTQARENIGVVGTGKDGKRGTGLLPVTTAPSSYTTQVNGLTPAYRIALSTVKSQASVDEVFTGDTVRYSYYHYPVIYVDSSYVYCRARVNIRGAAGEQGEKGDPGVYILSEGETIADAPGDASVVIDPNGEPEVIPGGSGGASSWEDLGSTFEQGVLLAETNPMFVEDEGTFYLMDAVKPMVAGEEYSVNWNSTEYSCICEDYIEEDTHAGWMLGNTSMLGGMQENELPFLIIVPNELMVEILGGITGMIVPLDGTTELTISITGEVEVIHPMPAKYLPELKGQKQIIIDIDNQTASIPFETAWAMSVNELQATITLRYNSIESAVMVVRRQEVSQSGIELKRLRISFANITNVDEPLEIREVDWQDINGETEIRFHDTDNRFFIPIRGKSDGMILFSAPVAGGAPSQWARPDNMVFSTIKLQSKSGKVFMISVDDNGNLTAT